MRLSAVSKMGTGTFRFKHFTVDQSHCAMKINTDGVLLGAIAEHQNPASVLDIGAGTGVIALMLAQRYGQALVDAVEIDVKAATTAQRNFQQSPFAERMSLHPESFESYFEKIVDKKYDLIVSNPPFYLSSLKSPVAGKNTAKHADPNFFENLVNDASAHLGEQGALWLIIPVEIVDLVLKWVVLNGLEELGRTFVKSYPDSLPHRIVLRMGFNKPVLPVLDEIVIYQAKNIYTEKYKNLLRDFFLAF